VSLSGSKTRLSAVTKELSVQWAETKHHWHDVKSQEFDSRYMQELFARVDRAVGIIEKLDEVLAKVRKDCE
jgi:hypothetical protein